MVTRIAIMQGELRSDSCNPFLIYCPSRNAVARREYQVKYNRVRRLTRRKLGKVKLAALRETRWKELKGLLP